MVTTLTIPTAFGNRTVKHGVLDKQATLALGTGHCVAFAVALYDATGWDIVVDLVRECWDDGADLREAIARHDDLPEGLAHAWVRRPDGLLLDARGVRTVEQYEQNINDEFDEDVRLYDVDRRTAVILASQYCATHSAEMWEWVRSMVAPVLAAHGTFDSDVASN